MNLTIDDYLAWTPWDITGVAMSFEKKSESLEDLIRTLRDAADRGTEGQEGPFIESRKNDTSEFLGRIAGLADILAKAALALRTASYALGSKVRDLRELDAQVSDEGFTRVDGSRVVDTRTSYEDDVERAARTERAKDLEGQIRTKLDEIREADETADVDLHKTVDRDVRDRTAAGNGNPFAAGINPTSVVTAVASAGASLVEGKWAEAARDAGRGLMQVRGLGPVMAVLGFAGAVAARPEDEPLSEAIIAEGIGTIAGAAGAPVGFAFGVAFAGPPGGAAGTVGGALGGGMVVSPLVASEVRAGFDRAN